MRVSKYLIYFTIFCILQPFSNFLFFFKTNTDLQPLFLIMVFIYFSVYTKFNAKEIIILISTLFICIFFSLIREKFDFRILSLFFLFLFYLSIKDIDFKKYYKVFYFNLIVIFILVILFYFNFDFYQSIHNIFVSRLANSTRSTLAIMSTEPGLMAGNLFVTLIFNDYFYKKKIVSKKLYLFSEIFILSIFILTKSGFGFIFFTIYLFFYRKLIFTFFALFLSLGFISNIMLEYFNEASMLGKILSFDKNLIYQDASLSKKIVTILKIPIYLLYFPFGGSNEQVFIFDNSNLFYNYISFFYDIDRVRLNVLDEVITGRASPLVLNILNYGIIYIVLLLYVFIDSKAKIYIIFFILLILSNGYSILYLSPLIILNKSLTIDN